MKLRRSNLFPLLVSLMLLDNLFNIERTNFYLMNIRLFYRHKQFLMRQNIIDARLKLPLTVRKDEK